MQIKVTSVMVDNQDKALAFYTGKLGFKKGADIDMGGCYRWLTVVSPEGMEGVELSLDPLLFEPAKVYQKALYDAGMPLNAFVTTDVDAEAQKLRDLGVVVRGEPVDMGPIKAVMFEDGCGNLLHLVQPL
ncbi:glyoxalase [Pelomonas sp. HMWF004]|nr:glyoxalase [Pelomonas sp. HMWF004]